MISFLIGPQGALAEWCEAIIATMKSADGAHSPVIVRINSLAELGRQILRSDGRNMIAVARSPDPSLCNALIEENCPLLLLLEEPTVSAAILVDEHGASPAEAVRLIANAHPATLGLARASNALVISRSDLDDDAGLAERIVKYLFPAADQDIARATAAAPQAKDIAQRALRQGKEAPGSVILPDWPSLLLRTLSGETLAPTLASTVHAAVDPLISGTGRDSPVIWPRELFLTTEGAPGPATGIIDVTGKSRCLLYGPYLRLPVGQWSCALMFGCDGTAVGLPMVADIVAGRVLNQVSFTIESGGIFEVEIPFENTEADSLIEVRLFTAKAAFEGHIVLGRAKLTPLEAKRLKVN